MNTINRQYLVKLLPLLTASALMCLLPSSPVNAAEKITSGKNLVLDIHNSRNWMAEVPKQEVNPTPTPADQTTTDTPVEEAPTTSSSSSNKLSGPTAAADEIVTIPQSSALIISFAAELILDPKRKHNVPITLQLLQPIVDTEGQIVAPAKSLVTAQIKAMQGGDLIEAIAVVVGGRVIPIHAMGLLVPAQHKPEDVANPVVNSPGRLNSVLTTVQQSSAIAARLGSSGKRLNTFDVIDLGLSLGVGLTNPVPKIPPAFVNIAQGSVYVLTLASPVAIPKRLVETGIQIRESLGEEGTILTTQ
ncbi:MAG: hypothetical protein WCD18_02850 [Thermosynechococcaceae cyanobacterium]